jgi:hypothetical protein
MVSYSSSPPLSMISCRIEGVARAPGEGIQVAAVQPDPKAP